MRRRKRREEELREEMAAHLEFEVDERMARGMTLDAARAAARRRFGNAAAIAERTREVWSIRWLEALARDARYAARSITRRPAFTAAAVGSLAIALGANTAVFAFVNAIVLKRLPVAGAERLAVLRQKNEQFHMENCCFGYPFFRALRRARTDFDDVLAINSVDATMTDRGETERLQIELVSGNYFHMLGVRPAAGRLLDEADDAVEGASPVCVISYRLWQERFAGDPRVVGRRVMLNQAPFQIVGVSQAGFTGASLHDPRDVQVPAAMVETFLGERRDTVGFLQLIARLKPGVTRAQALVGLNAAGREIEKATGPRMGPHDDFLLYDGGQGLHSGGERFGKAVLLLALLVGVLLLVACANLAALLLVRSVERTREAGMRMAIGASRGILFRQFLMEAALLAAAGGAAGWGLGIALMRALVRLLPPDETLVAMVRPDSAVFGFAAAASAASGLLFGALPAWRASRAAPLAAIQGAAWARPGRRAAVSHAVIAAQIALSLALIFCAGLFARTLRNLRAVDLGFRPENVVSLDIDFRHTSYEKEAAPLFAELLHRARALPEARAAGLGEIRVISGAMAMMVVKVPGYVSTNGMLPTAYYMRISGGYFRALGTPLIAGRDFNERDGDGRRGEGAAIVNQEFARQFFGGEALGKTFRYGGGRPVRVVGISRTAKFQDIREAPKPVLYLPLESSTRAFLQVRTTDNPRRAMERLRAAVRDLAPGLPPPPATTMEMQIGAALSRERLLAFLSMLLGAVAAALAAIGLYGVLSFAVSRRTREIGIRMAIGARRMGIAGLFLRESAWMVAAGVAAGVPLMLGCGKLAGSLLYGVEAPDAVTLVAATAALGLIAFTAGAIPAVRAARVEPAQTLRAE